MQIEGRQLDVSAVPGPQRYALMGRLCRPACEYVVATRERDVVLGCNAVVIERQVLAWLAEIGRRHGFPVLRLTAEVVEGG